jgi:hypothetical protein
LGGISLSIPVHALLLLNGSKFGISGFLHRAVRGGKEEFLALIGLVLGGSVIGMLESAGPEVFTTGHVPLIISGLLVGVGSKMSNGCTSGHMLVGVSRFSPRSMAATATFFLTGVVTAQILHRNGVTPAVSSHSSASHAKILFAMQALPLIVYGCINYFAPTPIPSASGKPESALPTLRLLTNLVTAFHFAIVLRLSTLTESSKVIRFLLLPFRPAFDPSLAYLAAGAFPACVLLYRFCRGNEKPRLGGTWHGTNGRNIDARLLTGAALFGIGWGIVGTCPGPGFVNFGRALSSGCNIFENAAWIISAVIGGFLT